MTHAHKSRPKRKQLAAAWAVHAFTGTGVVLGFLALSATLQGDQVRAFLWLGVALFVDGIDGTLARRVNVKEMTPRFDGATLDNVIDYFTYVAVPALMVYWFAMVPDGWAEPAAAFMMATSLYTFANMDVKTQDYYFQGFPALWNVVVLYLMILRSPDWVNLGIIALCGVLTFVPWKYVHPLRVARFRPATIAATGVWMATSLWLLFLSQEPEHPMQTEPTVFWLWIAASSYFALICVARSLAEAKE